MAFDRAAYEASYFLPKSKERVPPAEEDIFQRYAITLPATDSEISTAIRAVRSYWDSQQPGSRQGKFAKMCIAAHEDLQAKRVEDGPNKGKDIATAAWWQWKQTAGEGAAKERVSQLSGLLKDQNGAFGVVTRSFLDACARRMTITTAQAEEAARSIGLEIVDDVDLPDAPPISQYAQLESELAVGQVSTVVELVHPSSGTYRLLKRFESVADPDLLLDVPSLRSQEMLADRQPKTSVWTAKIRALGILRTAVEGSGADLRKVALYHLVTSALDGGVPGPAGIKAELVKKKLDEREANILAVILADRAGGGAQSASTRVEQLLQSGRLREAKAVAGSLQEGTEGNKQISARIQQAQAKLDALLVEARTLLTVPDEVAAAAKVREARAISEEDADELLALIPLPPARDLRIDVDGSDVRMHWQPNVGHDADTTYRVVRSLEAPATNPASGGPITPVNGTTATDGAPPVAQTVHYSVFASTPGRPSSRPASDSTVVVPPVRDARMETGPDWVSAHWSSHPSVHHIEAVRRDGKSTTPLDVKVNSAKITGLPEGLSVHIELTAVYVRPQGGELRSPPVTVAGTPRAAAKPLENLRAQPIASPSGVQVALSWTPIDRSDVRLRRSGSAPQWNIGQMVAPEEMTAWGDDVTGPTDVATGKTTLTATLPAGVHYVVPFSVGGTGTVVGRAVSVGVTDPVEGLKATVFKGYARLSWTWPETSSLAELVWRRDDDAKDAAGVEKISRAQYDGVGARVPLGSAPCAVTVRALMVVEGKTFASPPQFLTISEVEEAAVDYEVASSAGLGRLGGRTKTLTLTAKNDTGPVRVAFVAAPGIAMPLDPSQGITLIEESVTLAAGATKTFPSVKIPAAISRPYWVRCFLLSGAAQLQDPPLNTLKDA